MNHNVYDREYNYDKLNRLHTWQIIGNPRTIVSADNIRMAMNGVRYEPLAETMVFAIKHIMIRAMLDRNFDVIVDGTNSTKISLQRLLEIDPNLTPIFIDTPVDVCKQRAVDTGRPDLIPVIERISGNINKIKEVGFQAFIAEIITEINQRGNYKAVRTV